MAKDKGRLPPFVPLFVTTLDSRAWRAMSHGAQALYIALKRRVPKGRNQSYISYRDAIRELQASRRKIGEWFKELKHYGFIVLAAPGCLGVEGKGRSPHWRLTEMGASRKTSATDQFEHPTVEFMRWDGELFEPPRRRNCPGSYGSEKTESQSPRRKRGGHHVGNGGGHHVGNDGK